LLIVYQVFLLTEWLQDSRKYIMGHETAGEVVALGAAVSPSNVKIGKLYVVMAINPCVKSIVTPINNSFGIGYNGGYAEYAVVKAVQLVPVVSLMTHFSKDKITLIRILCSAGERACTLCSRHGRRWCHRLQGYHQECLFLQNVQLQDRDV
jgi:threonine dehydrogenase-like Zn-dependent dehydrogenase